MKRIDIVYGGQTYSVGDRDADAIRDEVDRGVAAGRHWLTVNDGEGAPREAHLLLTPGVPIAIIPIPDHSPYVEGPPITGEDPRP